VPTYRAIDLDGNLLDKRLQYDAAYLNKILKTMIFVDEMDDLLLKVKAQGSIFFTQVKYPSIWPLLANMPALLAPLQDLRPEIWFIRSTENKAPIFGGGSR
jgi:hypothetical protein